MTMSLVIMAAGLGSRFGGTKQLAEIGPGGEAILDYTIHDGVAAGFDHVVIIVRSEIEADVASHVAEIHGPDLAVSYVCQDTFGPQRDKPWGTAHAVMAVGDVVDGSMAVVNADDHYGTHSFAILSEHMGASDDYALVGFQLGNTLSDLGTVSRGTCRATSDGYLSDIVERFGLAKTSAMAATDDGATEVPLDSLVSMNMWGFGPSLFGHLAQAWEAWHPRNHDDPKAEFLLPTVLGDLIDAEKERVKVLSTPDSWLGITHPQDLAAAKAQLATLIDAGIYPASLRRA